MDLTDTAQDAVSRRDHLRLGDERGAGTLEYVGLSVVVSVIIAGMAAAPWMPSMTSGIQGVICSVFSHMPGGGGSCDGVIGADGTYLTEESYQTECTMNSATTTRGNTTEVMWGEGGTGIRFVETMMSDGSTRVTLVDTTSLGANAKTGASAGPVELNLNAGVSGTYGNGDTWVFPPGEEDAAAAFAQEAEDYANNGWNQYMPGGSWFTGTPDSTPPQISTHEVSINADVGINLGLGRGKKKGDGEGQDGGGSGSGPSSGSGSGSESGSSAPPVSGASWSGTWLDLPGAGAKANAGATAIITTDRGADLDDPGDDTYSVTVSANAGANANAGVGPWDADANANAKGTYTVEFGADGVPTSVTFQTITNADADAGRDNTVSTVTLDLSSDADLQAFDDWLSDPQSQIPSVDQIADNPPGEEASDFEQALYDRGVLTRNQFDGELTDDSWRVGAKILGVGAAYGVTDTLFEETLTNAEYAGKPQDGQPREWTENPRCQ